MDSIIKFAQTNYWLVGIFVAVLVIYLIFELLQKSSNKSSLNIYDAINIVNRGNGIFLDIRDEIQYEAGYIVNALNITLNNLENSIKKLHKHKKKPIVVYCNAGITSLKALEILNKNGFEEVYSMKGGISQWQKDQMPISKITKPTKNK